MPEAKPETEPETNPKAPKTPGRAKRLFWRLFKIGFIIAVLIHLYVIALRFLPVPGTILMGQRSLQGEDIQRNWTKLSDMSPYVTLAVMGGEDSRFCEHHGIDWDAIEAAIEDNEKGGRRRGGSTITQQTAKNVFFWNGGGYVRKAGEAYFALLIDFVWGKTRVMEVYLNVAEWGDGIFGIEAAAQARFGKSAQDLTRREAALLAAVLPSPNKWRLDPPTQFVKGRAGTIQQRMAIIQNSRYASCVKGAADLQPIPAKTSPPNEPKPETESELEGQLETDTKVETDAEVQVETTTDAEMDEKTDTKEVGDTDITESEPISNTPESEMSQDLTTNPDTDKNPSAENHPTNLRPNKFYPETPTPQSNDPSTLGVKN